MSGIGFALALLRSPKHSADAEPMSHQLGLLQGREGRAEEAQGIGQLPQNFPLSRRATVGHPRLEAWQHRGIGSCCENGFAEKL